MQTMEANINRLLTETYISLCPVVINYLYNKTGDYELAKDLSQDVFLRLMDLKQVTSHNEYNKKYGIHCGS